MMMGAPQPARSPTLAAGRPPISTVALPFTIGVGGCGPASGGMAHVCVSPNTAAGIPPIKTVATPGPAMVPGCPVGSPTRAAGGMFSSSVDLHRQALNAAGAPGLNIDGCTFHIHLRSFDRNLHGFEFEFGRCLDGDRLAAVVHLDSQRPCRVG